MNGRIENLTPETAALLRRYRMLGNWTHVCDFSDAFMWAVITFCVALLALGGAALSGLLLYWSWERYFTSGDDDAGLAVAMIALYIFFKPLQYIFVFCNYKRGVYHRML